jgi:organic hydroperoxide reductase OsmC/OhrA
LAQIKEKEHSCPIARALREINERKNICPIARALGKVAK